MQALAVGFSGYAEDSAAVFFLARNELVAPHSGDSCGLGHQFQDGFLGKFVVG